MWWVNRKGIVGKTFKFVNGAYMTEFNAAEAQSLLNVMNLAKERAHRQAEKMSQEELDKARLYIATEDPHLWDLYESGLVEGEGEGREVVSAIGLDPDNISPVEFHSLANAYEDNHSLEWLEKVKKLLKDG